METMVQGFVEGMRAQDTNASIIPSKNIFILDPPMIVS